MQRRGPGWVHDDMGPCLNVMISKLELDVTLKSGQGASLDAPQNAVPSRKCWPGVRDPSAGMAGVLCPCQLLTSACKISRRFELIRCYSVHVSVGESKRRRSSSDPRRCGVWGWTQDVHGETPASGRLAASGARGPLESGGCGKCRPLGPPALAGGFLRDLVLLQRPAADPGVWSPSHELFENGAVAPILEGQIQFSDAFRLLGVGGVCRPPGLPGT